MRIEPRVRRALLRILIVATAWMPLLAHADTVASLLGNFTINQFCGFDVAPGAVRLHYVVVFGQLPALRELHEADADRDGVTTQQERDAYVARLAPGFAQQLQLTADGVAVPLAATRWTSSLPAEQSGFSMRLDIDFEGRLPASLTDRPVRLRFENGTYDGRIGWHEIVVRSVPGVALFETGAYDTSLTKELTEALAQLPASGPLDERAFDVKAVTGAMPRGAQGVRSRGEPARAAPEAAAPAAVPGDDTEWLQRRTRQLVTLISTPTVAPHVAVLALLAAMVLGALHAFSPGHGKTIVGAYLVGSRSTPRHAVFLGITVTVTHTLVVFLLGLATLFASRYVLPERLFPALSLLSGLLVLGMGLVLLMQRWKGARNAVAGALLDRVERALTRRDAIGLPDASTPRRRALRLSAAPARTSYGITGRKSAPHAHRHTHASAPPLHHHGSGHAHFHGVDGLHSHDGGTPHSHLPPGATGERVTWRSLLALGVSGGLVPCPSAMVLLLAAIALNKTVYGLLMVVAFSLGLAATLIAVGMLFLFARSRIGRLGGLGFWSRVLPAVSAALITVVGLVLCYGALTSFGLGPLRA